MHFHKRMSDGDGAQNDRDLCNFHTEIETHQKFGKPAGWQSHLQQVAGKAKAVDQPEHQRHDKTYPAGVTHMTGQHQVTGREETGADQKQAWKCGIEAQIFCRCGE